MDLLDWLKPFVLALGLSLGSLCHIYGLTQKIGKNQPKIHDSIEQDPYELMY